MTGLVSCRWDWCRSSFPNIDALDTHVKHDHIWPMKPMRTADIALMRRMDLQSLHSSQNTDSDVISKGVSRNKTPPVMPHTSTPNKRPENEAFDTFTQLSSPPQIHSSHELPASPALERLMKQNGHSGLSAAIEIFERTRKIYQRPRLPSRERSITHRPLSESSGSSQEVVEQQLTQGDVGPPHPSEPQIEDELVDLELRWPTDDELLVVAAEEVQSSEQHQGISSDLIRGRNFRHGSLNVPLGVNNSSANPHASESQCSHSESEPIVLQTQAPYSSQTMGWSQAQ